MRTFPTIKGNIGDWNFYLTTMKMAELANYVMFADEIFPKSDLDQIMQRELTQRSKEISAYLDANDQRFLGALIVAAVGGEPKFVPISLGDSSIFSSAEDKIGFLKFDGTEKYYALDGQHRLAAIRDVLKRNPTRYAKDEVSLILIWHEDDPEGRKRARRLFTTVNRYAKKTSKTEDLVIDEDNPVDIYTRRLVREHAFFRDRVKISNVQRAGEFKLTKSESLKPEDEYDRNFLMALLTFKRCNEILLRAFLKEKVQPQVLPNFDTLEEGFALLNRHWATLLESVPIWSALQRDSTQTLDKYRKKHGGSVLARPIAIIAFITAATKILESTGDEKRITKVAERFDDLTKAPWLGLLWKVEKGGMHDGQARRNAAAQIFSHYLSDSPTKAESKTIWESATGVPIPYALPNL